MKGLLGIVGRLGKGFATLAGVLLGGSGIIAGGNDKLAECITALSGADAGTATLVGVALVVFGIGRKAGWVAAKKDGEL